MSDQGTRGGEAGLYDENMLARDLDLALTTPTLDTRPGASYSEARLDYGMSCSIESTGGDRLWLAWFGGGDGPSAFLMLSYSDDRGDSWSDPVTVVDPEDGQLLKRRCLVAVLWRDPTGRLWLFFDAGMDQFDGRNGVWATVCADAGARTPTWSVPQRIWHGAALQKPTALSNGEWILPISLWQRHDILNPGLAHLFADLDPLRGAHVLASTDSGQTWTRRGHVTFDHPTFDEHMIVERADGDLWMLARSNAGPQESFSGDGGRTWTPPRRALIQTVSARHHLRRLPSGRVLLVKNGAQLQRAPRTRTDLTAFLSDDDGRRWTSGLILDRRSPVTYPDAAVLGDGTIVVAYDYDRDNTGDILIARFTEDDIRAGEFASPDSYTGRVAKRARRSPAYSGGPRYAEPRH